LSRDKHLLATYGQTDSWTLGYNLFADVWLETNLVESSVYIGHSNFIHNLVLTSNFSTFGMPIDNAVPTSTNVAVSAWSLFVAAMDNKTNTNLRSDLISRVNHRMAADTLPGVFPVYYDSVNGTTVQGAASPAQGAMFAPLALTISPHPVSNATPTKPSEKRNIGLIIGKIVAGVAAVLFMLIGFVIFKCVRRRRNRAPTKSVPNIDSIDSEVTPLVLQRTPTLDGTPGNKIERVDEWVQQQHGGSTSDGPLSPGSCSTASQNNTVIYSRVNFNPQRVTSLDIISEASASSSHMEGDGGERSTVEEGARGDDEQN